MKISFNATIVVEMNERDQYDFYGFSEPTIEGFVRMLEAGEFFVEMPKHIDSPVFLFQQTKNK